VEDVTLIQPSLTLMQRAIQVDTDIAFLDIFPYLLDTTKGGKKNRKMRHGFVDEYDFYE
jgi:hypothetical protein